MEEKTYILQKDLPDVDAGAKFELGKAFDAYYLTSDKTGTKYNCYVYPKAYVENNPEWFLPATHPYNQGQQEAVKEIELSMIEQMKPYMESIEHSYRELDKLMRMVGISEDRQGGESKPIAEQPEKDWQIECFTDGKYNYWRQNNGTYSTQPFSPINESHFLYYSEVYKIYSVRRLSDQTIFSIGDEVECANSKYKIKSFKETEWNMTVNVGMSYPLSFSSMKKLPQQIQRVKMFTAGDGVDIYEGDCYWSVNDDFEINYSNGAWGHYYENGIKKQIAPKTFSTKEAAEKYIAEQKSKPQEQSNNLKYNTISHEELKKLHPEWFDKLYSQQQVDEIKQKAYDDCQRICAEKNIEYEMLRQQMDEIKKETASKAWDACWRYWKHEKTGIPISETPPDKAAYMQKLTDSLPNNKEGYFGIVYTPKEVDEMCEKVFNAAREINSPNLIWQEIIPTRKIKYPDYQSYKNSK